MILTKMLQGGRRLLACILQRIGTRLLKIINIKFLEQKI